ncbi:hypothetical protein AgCh_013404 [Apium graveolens]
MSLTTHSSSLLLHSTSPLNLSPVTTCILPCPRPSIHTLTIKKSRIYCTDPTDTQQQQLNLSVLRFTLGIPGLDESSLPRWIGYAFGSLLLLNHFVGSDSNYITPSQLRTEALGISLAAFSVFVPFLGKFLKGASQVEQAILPDGSEQVFVMSQNISNIQKEDLAWGTYILLRNTNTVSVIISVQGALCVRGYWNTPENISKNDALGWFEKQIEQIGLSNLKDTLYFPQSTDSELWKILPVGARSLLVQPLLPGEQSKGFLLVASSISFAYNKRDRLWIKAIADKYKG